MQVLECFQCLQLVPESRSKTTKLVELESYFPDPYFNTNTYVCICKVDINIYSYIYTYIYIHIYTQTSYIVLEP